MRHYLYAATAFVLLISAPFHESRAQPATPDARYGECTQQVRTDAEAAYKLARAWYGQSQSVAAQHCMALALYELQNYTQAATMLEEILRRVPRDQARLWLSMKAQAAKSYLAADMPAPAETHLTEAMNWATEREYTAELLPLLLERAQSYVQREQYFKALQDLDHAASLGYAADVLLARAQLFLRMGMKPSARADIAQVLAQEPQNPKALALQQQVAE